MVSNDKYVFVYIYFYVYFVSLKKLKCAYAREEKLHG